MDPLVLGLAVVSIVLIPVSIWVVNTGWVTRAPAAERKRRRKLCIAVAAPYLALVVIASVRASGS